MNEKVEVFPAMVMVQNGGSQRFTTMRILLHQRIFIELMYSTNTVCDQMHLLNRHYKIFISLHPYACAYLPEGFTWKQPQMFTAVSNMNSNRL